MEMDYDCLMVDDEYAIAQATAEYLNLFGVTSAFVTAYEDAAVFVREHTVKLILLDINLGTESGFSLCRELRAMTNAPILFISARTADDDILTALSIGGDDYITKPYSLSILLAKVKAVLRRYSGEDSATVRQFGPLTIDFNSRRVSIHGSTLPLRELEYRLLVYLTENRNRVITKEELFHEVWKGKYTAEGTLAVHIRRLREKIEKNPDEPVHLKTVWGTGYLFESEE